MISSENWLFLKDVSKFGWDDGFYGTADAVVAEVFRLWKQENLNPNSLSGIHALDLAAGSSLFGWPPHSARLLAFSGANVIALDKNPQSEQDKSLFDSAEIDLIKRCLNDRLRDLEILKDKFFDMIISTNFVGYNSPEYLYENLSDYNTDLETFELILLDQLTPMLKEGGVIFLDHRIINLTDSPHLQGYMPYKLTDEQKQKLNGSQYSFVIFIKKNGTLEIVFNIPPPPIPASHL